MRAGQSRPVMLLCVSAATAVALLLFAQQKVAELSAAAAGFPRERLELAARLGASPEALASPQQRIAVLTAAGLIIALTATALLLRRRHPGSLTVLAFLIAGAELLSLIAVWGLASDGAGLVAVWRIWHPAQALQARPPEHDLKLLALGLLVPILLAGAAGAMDFGLRQARPRADGAQVRT